MNIFRWLFPKACERLRELDLLKRRIAYYVAYKRYFSLINHGATAKKYQKNIEETAKKFNEKKFWWMEKI